MVKWLPGIKKFPTGEKYSLPDQIRRCSRAVCSNVGEAYRKRKYPKHFASKISDADDENTETGVWCDFAIACKYITAEKYDAWITQVDEIGRMLQSMIEHPEKFS